MCLLLCNLINKMRNQVVAPLESFKTVQNINHSMKVVISEEFQEEEV